MDENTYRNPEPAPNSARKDQAAGGMAQAKGRVKESWGALTDNERLAAEGRRDQMAGSSRSKKGRFKERIKRWIDRF